MFIVSVRNTAPSNAELVEELPLAVLLKISEVYAPGLKTNLCETGRGGVGEKKRFSGGRWGEKLDIAVCPMLRKPGIEHTSPILPDTDCGMVPSLTSAKIALTLRRRRATSFAIKNGYASLTLGDSVVLGGPGSQGNLAKRWGELCPPPFGKVSWLPE
jgi:hypothetical protein